MTEKTMDRELPKISKDNKKFEFTEESITVDGTDGKKHTLYRIRAKRDMMLGGIVVRKGDLGGFIEDEKNLDFSEISSAWVFDNAKVYGDAKVVDNAGVADNAEIYDNAQVSVGAWIFGNAKVYEDSWASNIAQVYENAKVHGTAEVYGYAKVHGTAEITDNRWVSGDITEKNCVKEARRP
jgi:hypothetical protein